MNTKKGKLFFFFSIIFFLFQSLPLIAAQVEIEEEDLQPFIEKFAIGYIDWEEGHYYATVTVPFQKEFRGRPLSAAMQKVMAERAAEALSDSIFLQLAAGLRVDAENTLKDMARDNASIRLMGNIKGREKVSLEEKSGELKAVYRVSLRGVDGVLSNLYDRVAPKQFSFNNTHLLSKVAEEENRKIVLIIDARGIGAMPALFPQILDESNRLVFGASMMNKENAIENGVVSYVTLNPNYATYNSSTSYYSASDNIVFVKAITKIKKKRKKRKRRAIKATKSFGRLKANIIVGNDDAAKIAAANKKSGFFKTARVIVITEGAIGGTEGYLMDENIYRVSW